MKTAIGVTVISYRVDCPYCKETTYSDFDRDQWAHLEYADGSPHGELECSECKERFEMSIGEDVEY